MPRILVIGSSCAGKSTLAKKLANRLSVPWIQLDALNWLPDWVERDAQEFIDLVDESTPADGSWVVDGNYSRIRHLLWPRAQYAIWLNYPFHIVLWRTLKRTTSRVFNKTELYSGNRETFRKAFLSHDSMILWVLRTYHKRRRQIHTLMNASEYDHIQFMEIRHPSQAETLFDQLGVFNEAS